MRVLICGAAAIVLTLATGAVCAAEEQTVNVNANALANGSTTSASSNVSPDEAPPPAPYAKGLVVDASVGAIGFIGKFGKLAPPGPWFHGQVGYELLNWLMVYGEGELAFTDTSNLDNPPNVRSFGMFGFGGGARLTWRITDRIGIYGQPGIGMLKADTPKNTLGLHGFKDAEDLNLWLGFRAGFEWYQVDRHMALGLHSGLRFATGFEKTGRGGDTPLALDGGISLRYAF
ncbi:MAG: hypothetical protein U0270_30685 [Labilithrix sp.]